ncbi:hypothetical protein D8Y22_00340 [Salinadaptatus halalkaliphilus]|uniref:DUF7978 domain-containing protein n=1 Tax=Salinadaptatus halalkaliphilus TaxID=2419781 RepID=A0A4S3TVA2_9EURY|nr:hypothetical protein [Salinadaptatus halalkaliphilus]THE66618.1 hypothetical protein D8Y22_00340 [Salinadaptatus halalkaliphilus]
MSQQRLAATDRSVSRASSVAASAGLGVIAAVVGYLLTYVLAASQVREVVSDSVPEWIGVAWFYYNAHLVEIETTGEFGGLGGTTTVDFLAESESTRTVLLYAVPPLVLVGVGALLAYQLGVTDLGGAVIVGVPVTIGYVLVMTIGAVVAETSSEGSFFGIEASGSMSPELLPAIVLAGLLYPLVFAPVGSVLVTVMRDP